MSVQYDFERYFKPSILNSMCNRIKGVVGATLPKYDDVIIAKK